MDEFCKANPKFQAALNAYTTDATEWDKDPGSYSHGKLSISKAKLYRTVLHLTQKSPRLTIPLPKTFHTKRRREATCFSAITMLSSYLSKPSLVKPGLSNGSNRRIVSCRASLVPPTTTNVKPEASTKAAQSPAILVPAQHCS